MVDRKKRVPLDPNTIGNDKEEWIYWKERLGVSGGRLSGAVRVAGRSVKDVVEYMKEDEAYRKALQKAVPFGPQPLPPRASKAARARKMWRQAYGALRGEPSRGRG